MFLVRFGQFTSIRHFKHTSEVLRKSHVEPMEPMEKRKRLSKLKLPGYGVKCPHHCLCAPNASTEKISKDQLNKRGIWNSTHPYPANRFLETFDCDTVLRLVNEKMSFVANLTKIKDYYKKHNAKVKTHLKRLDDENADATSTVNSNLIKLFAEALESDPDKYFSGCYNWYFTGGNMDFVNLDGQELLIHSEGSELQNLKISELQGHTDVSINTVNSFNRKLSKLHSLLNGKTIFEIKSTLDTTYFTVRQKQALSIMDLREDCLIIGQIPSDVPLVTSAMDSLSKKLILIDAKQYVKLYSLSDLKKPFIEGKIFDNEMTVDNWSTVRCIKPNLYLCANRNKICFFDARQSLFSKPSISYDFTNSMGQCEDISCIESSNTSSNTFIATTHKLLAMDVRCYKDDKMPMFRWIHQMKTAPNMIDIIKKDNTGELIAISGCKYEDIRICDTTFNDTVTLSPYLPYKPKSIYDSYEQASSFLKCSNRSSGMFHSKSLISEHLRLSNTGIKLKQIDFNPHKYVLLSMNSCGDIYTQEIFRKQDRDEDSIAESSIVDKFEDWDNALFAKRENKFFGASDITSFDSMVKFLRCNMPTPRLPVPKPVPKTPEWKISLQELSSFQDFLVEDILKSWDIQSDAVPNDSGNFTDRTGQWVSSLPVNNSITEGMDIVKEEDMFDGVSITKDGLESDARQTIAKVRSSNAQSATISKRKSGREAGF